MHRRKVMDDRRQQELGPPEGWKDRRHQVERRQIGVAEISLQEWVRCLPRESVIGAEGEMLNCDSRR